jgi:asparagine synthase (glutamine-hydrolysing)
MCGIAGFVGPGEPSDVRAMMAALVHRGPDGAGAYHDADCDVYLGHQRLSIVDLAGGVQPMWNAAHTIGVVYNGEIYNHKELRAQLEAKGYRFQTDHSDTEVLIHGYAEWGESLPSRLNGMFAFCIYDRTARRLLLARDRFGEKPLYFAQQGGLFAFASELSAIAQHSRFSARLKARSLQKLMAYGFLPAPNAILENCEKLPGGSFLIFDVRTHAVRIERYWKFTIAPDESWNERPEGELVEELRALLFEAVRRRMVVADVPLGFFLSGGLDSSAVLAAATRYAPAESLSTFTLGFTEPSFDESTYARQVADALGAKNDIAYLDLEKARECAQMVLSRLDEPLGDPSVLPTFLLGQFARQSVKVVLSGDGGDELFAGYDPFSALMPAGLYSNLVPRPLHQLLRYAVGFLPISANNMSLDFKLRRALAGLSYGPSLWNPVWLAPVEPDFMAHLFEDTLSAEELYSEAIDAWEAGGAQSTVDRTLTFYTNFYLPDNILVKVDRATMMSSLESRAVLLDNDLVEFCQRLPHRFKMRNGQRKYLLKKAMEGLLPRSIIERRKKGFGIPTARWLRSLPKEPPLAPISGVRMDHVSDAWKAHRNGEADHRLFLWSWLSLQSLAYAHGGAG